MRTLAEWIAEERWKGIVCIVVAIPLSLLWLFKYFRKDIYEMWVTITRYMKAPTRLEKLQ